MCIKGKQPGNHIAIRSLVGGFASLTLLLVGSAQAQDHHHAPLPSAGDGIGGIILGDNLGGLADRAYVSAPPDTEYRVSLERGSFLDCGAGQATFRTDNDGRSMVPLVCGVTLTETLVIPSASKPARLIIHY